MQESRFIWLSRAWKETRDFFDLRSPRKVLWPALIFVFTFAAQGQLSGWGPDFWHDKSNWLVSAVVASLFGVALFMWNLVCAPFRCERDRRVKAESALRLLTPGAPIIKVRYDTEDCNSTNSSGSITLTYGGRYQIANLAKAKVTRVRCENPSAFEIKECSGYITLIERLCEQSHEWTPVWRDALAVLWDHTNEVSTTIPPRAARYLRILQMTGNDMPVIGANPLPFGAVRLFEPAGSYRLTLEVCAAGKEGVTSKFRMSWNPPAEPIKWPDTGTYPGFGPYRELWAD